MSNVLITGIAGFIGSSLARGVLAENGAVRGIDDLSSGNMENLVEIRRAVDFREASILDAEAMADACLGIDVIFHEAAIPSVPLSVEDPVGTNETNLCGTLAMLEAARKAGVKRVIYAASSAAYGESPELPKKETMLPAPISPYGVQKLAGEYYLSNYARLYGMETVSLRYFNIFGPRQDPTSPYSGVLSRFISQMLAEETPTIFGDGMTSRDFTFIDNAVSANLLAAKAHSRVSGKVFNVATGVPTTLRSAYDEIKEITGYAGHLNRKPEREGDIKHSVADISLATKELQYKVITEFREGLKETIVWYRQHAATAV